MRGILTLCGSTKFKDVFEEVNRRLTWSGWIVLSVGSFHHSEKDHDIAGQIIARKVKLDALHKEKIDMSQAIVVIDVDGYVGSSTDSEIKHALKAGKEIFWYDVDKAPSTYGVLSAGSSWELLLDESPDDLRTTTHA